MCKKKIKANIIIKFALGYQGIIPLTHWGGFIFNNGTETNENERVHPHQNKCKKEGFEYIPFKTRINRVFGNYVISKTYDRAYVEKVADRLNQTVLKNSPIKAEPLKDWLNKLDKTVKMNQTLYNLFCNSNIISYTECIFVPDCVSKKDLEEATEYVNSTWYFKQKSLRVSIDAYNTKSKKDKANAAKPIPVEMFGKIDRLILPNASKIKKARIQGIQYALHLSDLLPNIEIRVICVADDIERNKFAYNKLKNNPKCTLIECSSNYDYDLEYSEENNMKINVDLDVMNPPYDGNLHLKILNRVLNTNSSCIINISPIRWIEDVFAVDKKNSDYYKYADVREKIKSVDVISARDSQDLFDIINAANLGIYTFGNLITEKTFKYDLIHPIIRKIKDKTPCYPIIEQNKADGWRVRIPKIASGKSGGKNSKKWYGIGFTGPFYNGMLDNKYWYTYYNRNQNTKETPEISDSISFGEDQISAKNFSDSLNTTFARVVEFNYLVDQHIYNYSILWTDDYKEPWTNERFCNYFDISGFISDTEAEPNSEWAWMLDFAKKEELI